MKAGISVSVAAKPSSDPPRLMRRGTAGQAAMATAGAAPAKGAERGRAGALPTAFPAGRYAGGAGCTGPSRPIVGGSAIFGPGMSFIPARSSTLTTAGIASDFSRAEGVWRRLSPVLRSAVLLLLRGAPLKPRREQHSPWDGPATDSAPQCPQPPWPPAPPTPPFPRYVTSSRAGERASPSGGRAAGAAAVLNDRRLRPPPSWNRLLPSSQEWRLPAAAGEPRPVQPLLAGGAASRIAGVRECARAKKSAAVGFVSPRVSSDVGKIQ